MLLFYFLVLWEGRYLGPTLKLHYRYTTGIVWNKACCLIDLIAIIVIRNGKVQSPFLVTVILYIDQTIFQLVLTSLFRSPRKVIHKNFLLVSCSTENNFFWADNQQNCDSRSNSALYLLNDWLFFVGNLIPVFHILWKKKKKWNSWNHAKYIQRHVCEAPHTHKSAL